MSAEEERAAIHSAFPMVFDDGARCGFLQKYEGAREPGGYPKGFNAWPLAHRNAWFSGFCRGSVEKKMLVEKEAVQKELAWGLWTER
jgi:hypothetical protein